MNVQVFKKIISSENIHSHMQLITILKVSDGFFFSSHVHSAWDNYNIIQRYLSKYLKFPFILYTL